MPPKQPAFDFKTSVKTPSGYGFQVSLKITDKLSTAAVVCGVMYWIQTNPDIVKAVVKAALEAVGVEVENVAPGSILVEVLCTSKESFLSFMDDFETNKIKQRLEKEFQDKLNVTGELEVKIANQQEVNEDLDQLRRLEKKHADEEVKGHMSVKTEVDISGIPITEATETRVPVQETSPDSPPVGNTRRLLTLLEGSDFEGVAEILSNVFVLWHDDWPGFYHT